MLAAAIPVADHFARKGAFDRKALVGSRSAPRENSSLRPCQDQGPQHRPGAVPCVLGILGGDDFARFET